ncbi:MAG: Holliday junction branch migration protein RuvA [Sphaerochaetaceae bacterium]|nr:Holliday junction branch migration protein RuvA [Sphaerochaetaceae bacterium]MDC7247363.1 Holliday junction branch migration protein RuvA [Sphaerochaetaceae bacterium]
MIYAISGELVHVDSSKAVIRTAGGVEYELLISSQLASRLSQLNGEARREIRLLTHLQHREDSMTLFGFSDEKEKQVFLELIKVNGIGAKQALKILSGVQLKAFIEALDNNDISFISSIPGIGPKTSQKIVLALRDTIVLDSLPAHSSKDRKGSESRYKDLIAALNDMGYDKKQVISTVNTLLEEHKEVLKNKNLHDIEEFIFKHAIIALG